MDSFQGVSATAPDDIARPVLVVGNTELTKLDLALVAVLTGEWEATIQRSARGAATLRDGLTVDSAVVKEAGRAFRYTHRLLSADELRAWLDARGLDASGWNGHFERWAASEHGAATGAADIDELRDVWWIDACISGLWTRCATTVTEWWVASQKVPEAAEPRLGEVEPPSSLALVGGDPATVTERLALFAGWRAAREALPKKVCTPKAIAKWLHDAQLDWTLLDALALRLPTEHVAREAVLCLTVDERPLAEVEALAGVSARAHVGRFTHLDPALAGALIARDPGSIVGPIRTDDEWTVAVLNAKAAPDPDDPELRAVASAALIADVVARTSAGAVRDLGPL